MLDLIPRLFVDVGDEAISCSPTFGAYNSRTNLCGGNMVDVPRDSNFAIDVKGIKAAITGRTRLIFLCNPNNPTGNLTPQQDLLEIAKTGVPVLVDEAYYEFTGETVAGFIGQYPNLIILRTFSKWAGMAGIRLAYCICTPELTSCLLSVKLAFHVGTPTIIAARESLKDRPYLMGRVKDMLSETKRLSEALASTGFFKPYPTSTNFIFVEVLKGDPARIAQELAIRGFLVRYEKKPAWENGMRVSIGLPEQNDKFIKALKQIATLSG